MLKYESVADDIRKKIATGEYGPNDQLPTTPELCDLYDVSKITIKKAMDELVQQGLIARRRGSGTYVKRVPQPEAQSPSGWDMSSQMAGFCADHPGVKVTSDVHEFSVVRPKPEVAGLLGMDPDEFTYYVCRTRLIDDVPQVIEYTFMPIKLIPDLRERNVESTIYGYIEGDLGLKIGSAHRTLRAVLPNKSEVGWLDVTPTTPLLEVEQVGYLDDGVPFEYSIARHARGFEFHSVSTH
ncbi:GntR family transcriptional regulator [Parafannyhessea umbonata]|jgi:GntR family transcriptional regulator|uniref:GntR family transcriptional regulator n=1 Tax=Parafannyhessea umbonata TaxID=604330 RepID=A0A6N7WW26_9ACTN|nr:GntR family transcriptional regulator [Parafannyhessea umbonata]MCI6681908.1 GntR family transcriptional regulator [Parafannyhessea umbonata]MCI7219685.1 GntR family transcriptional regulator [Parafannyhessea umbonata]MDD6360065.1 GntR family transcriptional regulator [Parafannyhessea umbonata]MDD6565728.1 GntR family transcriptional regulator [Parafannyhessea umbonata]MDD6601189.1 GntR family transcriptional regulator [Parafannyhessea umbonata]